MPQALHSDFDAPPRTPRSWSITDPCEEVEVPPPAPRGRAAGGWWRPVRGEASPAPRGGVRFWGGEGLIAPERQGLSRIYSWRDRARLAWILRGKRVGFSLADIREMIDLYQDR